MEHEQIDARESDKYGHNHRDSKRVRSKGIDRDNEGDWDERSTISSTSSGRGRDRDRDWDCDRERRRDKNSSKDRDRDNERDRERNYDRDRDRHRYRDGDRDADRHPAQDHRDRDRFHYNDRDRDHNGRDYLSSWSSSSSFSRPATYDPRLAQRTQQRMHREEGDELDERDESTMRRKQLQDELGLSDEDEQISSNGDAENKGASKCHNRFIKHIKDLQCELKDSHLAERKTQDSLNKLQLLSKSQTAILKASMSKKIQLKNALIEDMTNVIEKLERKLKESGLTFESYTVPDSEKGSLGRSVAANTASEYDSEAEFSAIKIEMERLIEENSALKAAATEAISNNQVVFPTGDIINKAVLDSVELENGQLMHYVKDTQKHLTAAVSPLPTLHTSDGSSMLFKVEEWEALKSKLSAADASYLNAQKKIQRLKKELARASIGPATISDLDDEKDQISVKKDIELQSQLREVETRFTDLQAELEQQKRDSQVKESTAVERYAKLKLTAERELSKIKEQAKKAILDLKRRLEIAVKEQQRKQLLLSNLNVQVKTYRMNLTTLKSQVLAQQQQVPVLAKQLTEKMIQRVRRQSDAMAGVVDNYKREVKERKRLFNLVQELKGNIRVLCRMRPISKTEVARGSKVICKFAPEEITLTGEKGKVKTWEFDHVFDMNSMQDQLFSEVKPLVTSILDGYSVCIFAYGQTGSGKTFTMSGSPENPGINTRSLQELFERKNERMKEYQDDVTVSVMEIYNEQIRDLLAQDAMSTNLQVRQGPTGNFVPGLTVVPVQAIEEVFELIKRGNKNRSTHATDMNEHSSRSHSILSVQLKSLNLVTNAVARGKLFLVDLAGSERISKTGAEGQRLKEAQNINKSLSALGDVIAARASKQKHVPYRNSSLTFLLQDALGGDSKTLMVACASPVDYNCEETFCTLNFAARTRSVEMGKATKNVAQAT